MSLTFSQALARGYLARDFIFFGVRAKYLAHIGAKKFEFMGTICLKSLIEHYLKKESFKICFFPFEIMQLKKINKHQIQKNRREYGPKTLLGPLKKYNLWQNKL